MPESAKIQFTPAQSAAITARGGSLLVSAAAGSGKTRVLVERVVGLITDPIHPVEADSLLIMTFTNAAAAKLRADITTRLAEEVRAHPGDMRLRRQQLLLQRAAIGTVDAFCLHFVQQHFAALLHILRPKNHVPAPVLPPHFRVAHMAGIAFWQRQHRPQLAEGAISILGRQTLPGGAPAVGEFHVAGVAQSQGALELDRAARVAAVAVILFIRHQGDRFVPPVQQIGRAPVSPALIGMVAGERVPLIKQVVTPGDLAKAVRIVQQSVDRRQMPLRIMAVGQRLRLALHNGLQDRRQT